MKLLIKNAKIHDGLHPEVAGAVWCEDGKITNILEEGNNLSTYESQADEVLDLQGKHLMPGMIDVHLHGGYGHDFIEKAREGVDGVGKGLLEEGTTGYMASLTVIDHPTMISLLKEYAAIEPELIHSPDRATFLGVHSEGPYLSYDYKALMYPTCLRDASAKELEEMKEAAGGWLRIMTIAPEREGALEMIAREKENPQGLTMMIGHSAATSQQAKDGLRAGAKGFTHLYNAMSPHTHRQPGCVTAALSDENCFCELICDGFHVHPDVVRLTYKILGPERIVLITDAMPGKGMPDGEYVFSKLQCVKKGNTVRVIETGRIAGSAITMMDAIRNMREFCQVSFDDLARMSGYNPACIAQVEDTKGSIEKGRDADLIVLDDEMNLCHVIVSGQEATLRQ